MRGRIQGDLFATAAQSNLESCRRFLSDYSKTRVELRLTRNQVSMASIVFVSDAHVRVRLHQQFLFAPQTVWNSLGNYLRRRRHSDWNVVAEFAKGIDTSSDSNLVGSRRRKQKGDFFDLAAIAKAVNQNYFNGRVKYGIEWGQSRSKRVGRRSKRGISIRYGSWSRSTRTIRIHPLLDDSRVPARFVEYIVFHEMLHSVVPSDYSNGKRFDHSETFRRLEKAFPELDQMQRLSQKLLPILAG